MLTWLYDAALQQLTTFQTFWHSIFIYTRRSPWKHPCNNLPPLLIMLLWQPSQNSPFQFVPPSCLWLTTCRGNHNSGCISWCSSPAFVLEHIGSQRGELHENTETNESVESIVIRTIRMGDGHHFSSDFLLLHGSVYKQHM